MYKFSVKLCLWRMFVALARRGTSSRARNPRRSTPPAAVASTTTSVISGTTRSRIDTAKYGRSDDRLRKVALGEGRDQLAVKNVVIVDHRPKNCFYFSMLTTDDIALSASYFCSI